MFERREERVEEGGEESPHPESHWAYLPDILYQGFRTHACRGQISQISLEPVGAGRTEHFFNAPTPLCPPRPAEAQAHSTAADEREPREPGSSCLDP